MTEKVRGVGEPESDTSTVMGPWPHWRRDAVVGRGRISHPPAYRAGKMRVRTEPADTPAGRRIAQRLCLPLTDGFAVSDFVSCFRPDDQFVERSGSGSARRRRIECEGAIIPRQLDWLYGLRPVFDS